MTKMNESVKARWVAALRSGEYKQGKNRLRADDKFCCLGVLCDLQDSSAWTPKDLGRFAFLGNDGMPPAPVRQWAGFEFSPSGGYYRTPKVTIGGERLDIDEHNDAGRTFAEIADAIEEQL